MNILSGHIFLMPNRDIPKNISCVYKIQYKSNFYYIGSTMCLQTRMSAHKVKSKKDLIVSVEVLAISQDEMYLRAHENSLIKTHVKDPMCKNKYSKTVFRPGRKPGTDNKVPITIYIETSVLNRLGDGNLQAGKELAVSLGTKSVYELYKTA